MENTQLAILWMQSLPAPEVVLEFMACKCTKQCNLPKCQCLSNGLKCSPACRLKTCGNMAEEDNDETASLDRSDDEDKDI